MSIDVYITNSEFEKLNQYVDFLPHFQYSKDDLPACKELGKIEIQVGPILRFHLKRPEMPIEIHEKLLKEANNIKIKP